MTFEQFLENIETRRETPSREPTAEDLYFYTQVTKKKTKNKG